MDLTHLIVILAVLSIVWVVLTRLVPMPAPVPTVISIVIAVLMILALLSWAGMGHVRL